MEIDLVEIQSSENYYELSLWPWGGAAILLAAAALISSGSLLIALLRQAGDKSASAYTVYDDDDDDESLSSCSTSSDDDAVVEEEEEEEEEDRACGSCDLIESGGGNEMKSEDRNRLPWPEGIGGGGGVVRAWDGLGLGFRTSRSSVPFIALLDPSRDEVVRWFPVSARAGETSAVSMVPRDVILSGLRSEMDGGLAVSLWDARVAGDVPAAVMRRRRRAAGEEWGTVADWRRVGSPTAATWWDDDDTVFVGGEGLEERWGGGGRGLVASWCRNAVRCFPNLPSFKMRN